MRAARAGLCAGSCALGMLGGAAAAEVPTSAATASSTSTSTTAPAAASTPVATGARVYDFQALLDGKPLGRHRFVVGGAPAARTVDSEADFEVRFLGLRVFHYHHHASEQWQGDCLQSLVATTDDDGKPASVHARRDAGLLHVRAPAGEADVGACVMSYAYWSPALREQAQLLNPQTGRLDAVRIERAGTGSVDVDGAPVPAVRWRIEGPGAAIDVWYSTRGDWIGLDSLVAGKRQLSYRLAPR